MKNRGRYLENMENLSRLQKLQNTSVNLCSHIRKIFVPTKLLSRLFDWTHRNKRLLVALIVSRDRLLFHSVLNIVTVRKVLNIDKCSQRQYEKTLCTMLNFTYNWAMEKDKLSIYSPFHIEFIITYWWSNHYLCAIKIVQYTVAHFK